MVRDGTEKIGCNFMDALKRLFERHKLLIIFWVYNIIKLNEEQFSTFTSQSSKYQFPKLSLDLCAFELMVKSNYFIKENYFHSDANHNFVGKKTNEGN